VTLSEKIKLLGELSPARRNVLEAQVDHALAALGATPESLTAAAKEQADALGWDGPKRARFAAFAARQRADEALVAKLSATERDVISAHVGEDVSKIADAARARGLG
jgi:hypothetical protein